MSRLLGFCLKTLFWLVVRLSVSVFVCEQFSRRKTTCRQLKTVSIDIEVAEGDVLMSRRMPDGKIKASRSSWMMISTSRLLTASLTLRGLEIKQHLQPDLHGHGSRHQGWGGDDADAI